MNSKKLNPRAELYRLSARLSGLAKYGFVGFIVFIAGLYAIILIRINTLSSQQPSSDSVSSQVTAAKVPRFNPTTIQQLQSLQDNSANVQTLFDQTRTSPFQEPITNQ